MLIRALDSGMKGKHLGQPNIAAVFMGNAIHLYMRAVLLEDAKYLFQLWDNAAFSSRQQLNETESSQPQMKPKLTAVNGSIPIDLIGTKTQLAFLSRVRLIYKGWIWEKSTDITEIRTWLINLLELGWLWPGKAELDLACRTAQDHSPQPTQFQKVIMFFSCGPDKVYAEAVKRVVVFSSRSQSLQFFFFTCMSEKTDKASTATATFTDLSR